MTVLCDAPTNIEGHDDRTGPADRQIELQIAAGVQHQDSDSVPLRNTTLAERSGEAGNTLAELGPRQFAVVLENRDTLRIDLKSSPQPWVMFMFAPKQ